MLQIIEGTITQKAERNDQRTKQPNHPSLSRSYNPACRPELINTLS